VADAVEPVGQDVDQKTADELVGVERQKLVAGVALGPVILVSAGGGCRAIGILLSDEVIQLHKHC